MAGAHVPAFSSFDDVITALVNKGDTPGVSLAIAHRGRIVYERAAGWGDLASNTPLSTRSRFRLASVSKPLTAMAVLHLVSDGKLDLDRPAVELLRARHLFPARPPHDARWAKITVHHLLTHTGGWDSQAAGDPMFQHRKIAARLKVSTPVSPAQVIEYMSQEPLQSAPGEKFAYSNFGYCLLGRVIEAVTGEAYGAFLRRRLAGPAHAPSLVLGRTRLADRQADEVTYHIPSDDLSTSLFPADQGRKVPEPYGAWSVETMDAHGGWVGTAADVVRVAGLLDEDTSPRFISDDVLRRVHERPACYADDKDVYYGLGWMVRRLRDYDKPTPEHRGYNLWHNGSLPGTNTLLVRRDDGWTWCALMNRREPNDVGQPAGRLDGQLHQALAKVLSRS